MSEEVTDVELVNPDNIPAQATEGINADLVIHNIDEQGRVLEKLREYVKSQLKPKVDYYSVKQGSLPSLGKPGAEKIGFIFNLVPRYKIQEKVRNNNEVYYDIQCELYHKYSEKFMGAGVGNCSSRERKYKNADVYDISNTIEKMAKKRSYIDAIISSTMASFLFTQDLEDMDSYYLGNQGFNTSSKSSKPKQTSKPPQEKQELDPDTFVLPFGKHKGEKILDIPTNYLQYLKDSADKSKYKESNGYVIEDWRNFLSACVNIKEALKAEDEREMQEIEDGVSKMIDEEGG